MAPLNNILMLTRKGEHQKDIEWTDATLVAFENCKAPVHYLFSRSSTLKGPHKHHR